MKKIIFICLFPFFAYGQNIKPAINLDGEWVAYPYGKDNKYDFYDPYIKYQFKADSFNCSNSMGIGNKNFVSRGVFFLQNNKIVFKTLESLTFDGNVGGVSDYRNYALSPKENIECLSLFLPKIMDNNQDSTKQEIDFFSVKNCKSKPYLFEKTNKEVVLMNDYKKILEKYKKNRIIE